MSVRLPGLDNETAARLLRRQDTLQTEARQIMRELNVHALLSQAGLVTEVGSWVTGLMAWPDIDFGITSPGLDSTRAYEIMLPLLAAAL